MHRSQNRYPEVDPGKRSPAVRVMAITFGILTLLFAVALIAAADT